MAWMRFTATFTSSTQEEPELGDWPKDTAFNRRLQPRGLLDTRASDQNNPAVDPRFGRVGQQVSHDTGALTRKRMETVDEEFLARTNEFIPRATSNKRPFFLWFAPSRMHIHARLEPEGRKLAQPDPSDFDADDSGMMEQNGPVGLVARWRRHGRARRGSHSLTGGYASPCSCADLGESP